VRLEFIKNIFVFMKLVFVVALMKDHKNIKAMNANNPEPQKYK